MCSDPTTALDGMKYAEKAADVEKHIKTAEQKGFLPIVVCLYQSCYKLKGIKFGLALLDEAHHLGGKPYEELQAMGEQAYIAKYAPNVSDEEDVRLGAKVALALTSVVR